MKFLESNFEFNVGDSFRVRPLRTIVNCLVGIALADHIRIFSVYFERTLWHVVFFLWSFTAWLLFAAYLVTRFYESDSMYKRIVTPEVHDYRVVLMKGMTTLTAGSLITYICARGFVSVDLPFAGLVPVHLAVLSVAVMKYSLARRLRAVRYAEKHIERVVSYSRHLLDCNSELNNTYSVLAASYCLFTLQGALLHSYDVWNHYTPGAVSLDMSKVQLHLGTLWIGTGCLSVLQLASVSSMVAKEVIVIEFTHRILNHCCNKRGVIRLPNTSVVVS